MKRNHPALKESDRIHPAVSGLIDGAVDRAVAAGAKPPLTYVGAGGYGIVLRDDQGLAYKVGRGYLKDARQWMHDEAVWLAFAGGLKEISRHVVRVHAYDEPNAVIIHEYIPARERWQYDDHRLIELHTRIMEAMRPWGFLRIEYKDDSYVYAPGRGPVLVDGGNGGVVGWRHARKAQELLVQDDLIDRLDAQSVIWGLRSDALRGEIPKAVAVKLGKALSEKYGVPWEPL